MKTAIAKTSSFLTLLLLVACGGGGGGGGDSASPGTPITTPPVVTFPSVLQFEYPSSFSSSKTHSMAAARTSISGDLASAYMPQVPCSDPGSLDFKVQWTNTATGDNGQVPIAFGCVTVIIGGVPVDGVRSAFEIDSVSLNMGSNRIELETFDGATQIGRDVVTIVREDAAPPTATATFPAADESGVPVNRAILVTFSEPMQASTLVPANILMESESGVPVEGTAEYFDNELTWVFQPAGPLDTATRYQLTLSEDISDVNGNGLDAPLTWSFDTATTSDMSPPVVSEFWPGDACNCAPPTSRILVNLAEPLHPASASSVSVDVASAGIPVSGETRFGIDYLEFEPAEPLLGGLTYTITVGGSARDLAGNTAPVAGSGNFTTQAQPKAGTWRATDQASAPDGMAGMQTVWTGSEILFWSVGRGLSFDPVANRWNRDADFSGGPEFYYGAASVWTGEEMIIWGEPLDKDGGNSQVAGGAYDPRTKTWRDILVPDGSQPRLTTDHTAVWTGSEVIIWGGAWRRNETEEITARTGWRYQPGTELLTRTATFNAPSSRRNARSIWTGSEMIVFGGVDQQGRQLGDGGIYNPQLNEWRELPAIPGSFVAGRHTDIVWTGQEMIVWNGGITRDGQAANSERRTQTLFRFDPVTNTWQQSGSGWEPFTVSTNSVYQSLAEDGHFVTWTGDRMLVVSKFPDDPSYLYDPLTDEWQPVESPEAFNLIGAATIWAGDRLVHWGGRQGYVFDSNVGLILEL